ncbi:UrcA family protein [Sphingomonas sp. AOB5]|uniref:UrcA family protein n=1 Tax=Sphingomonas sp. AOB5 TaxID=3034017 RepID=UPI0023F99A7C|nr:UrcA family protein [Sphingomonas sp. AOB5]MDF7775681.1 UrcA family protein [Sphingomonas sp. AOB5]
MIATLISIAALAVAAPNDPVPGVRVAYADLNLNHAEGIAELDRRIKRAVHLACPTARSNLLSDAHSVELCRRTAMRNISAQRDKAIASARARNVTLAGNR